MALANLQSLLSRLVAELQGLHRPLGLLHLEDAARRLLGQSGAWAEWLPAVTATADQTDFTLAVPAGYKAGIRRVMGVEAGGLPLDALDWSFAGGVLTLLYGLRAGQTLRARVVFEPALDCAEFPAEIVRDHGLAICEGAKASLKAMAGKPWSDPQGARDSLAAFSRAIGDATRDRDLAGKTDIRIPIPRF